MTKIWEKHLPIARENTKDSKSLFNISIAPSFWLIFHQPSAAFSSKSFSFASKKLSCLLKNAQKSDASEILNRL